MFPRRWHHSFIAALCGGWVFIGTVGAGGEEATTPQVSAVTTAQAGGAAVQNFTEILKAEAERAEAATKHDREVIEHALTFFEHVVGVAGTILVAGAALLGWALTAANRATKADIKKEVREQLHANVVEEIQVRITETRTLIENLHREAKVFSEQLNDGKDRVSKAERRISEQQDAITKLVLASVGKYPYDYLKSIFNKTEGSDPDKTFMWHPNEPSFKREMGFLIDNGYIENINLDLFTDEVNILKQLKITEEGKLYVRLRESLTNVQ